MVAPTSVASAWVREAARFTPGLRVVALTETGRRRGTTVVEATGAAHLVVTSYAIFRIDGAGYRARDRPKRIAAVVEGSAPVFVISLKAGGSNLTLTEADYVFVLDPWWNPAVEAHAIDRAHRIGQDKTVMVYRLVSESRIEEKVLELQERKRELFARVVDDGGLMAAPLAADDIRSLLGTT